VGQASRLPVRGSWARRPRYVLMLQELIVENFALIDRLRVKLGPGLTVLTGETGAGKSIIIDALSAALGDRVSSEAIRHGADKALVEAVFDARDCPQALASIAEAGLDDAGEDIIVLSRQIANGRSVYRVNHRPATLALLQEIGRHLVDIHGQHEHQTLIHEEFHLQYLDNFGADDYGKLLAQYAEAFGEFAAARRALANSQLSERERAQRMDMLRFQVDEIAKAGLEPGEQEDLETERTRLSHAEKLREAVAGAHRALEGDDASGTVLDALLSAESLVTEAARLDATLEPLAQELSGVAVAARETARGLQDYLHELEFNPQRLEAVQSRLSEISALKRKYGDSIEEILDFYEHAAAELAEIESAEERTEELTKRVTELRKFAGAIADDLSAARQQAAGKLAKLVEGELANLGMPNARFAVELEREVNPEGLMAQDGVGYAADASGIDRCRFLLSANKGETLRPLSSVASGGELSRLMLVFKSICSRSGEIPTIIFDEIDAGIGGVTAHAVARKLVEVSRGAQVMCVTHLPQIARLADHQVHVAKQVTAGRTVVRTTAVDGEQRVAELVRMLGVSGEEEAAYQHAHQMLQEATAERQQLRTKA